MSAAKPKKIKPGATRRLEIHTSNFAAHTYWFKPRQVGELFQMLMAEVGNEPVTKSKDSTVQRAFDKRREYSRIRGSFGRSSLSLAIRRQVFERDGATCRYCREPMEWADYHCDHIKPVKIGGEDDLKNLAASCRPCNLSKAAKPLKEWLQ